MRYGESAYYELGRKIKAQRKELGMTQQRLSEGIVTRNMLSRIENGTTTPSLDTLVAIAERLGVSVSYLLDDSLDEAVLKDGRLLELIEQEVADENYLLALQYIEALDQNSDQKNSYSTRCKYLFGLRLVFSESLVREAQKYISDALKLSSYLDAKTVNEGKVYRALLDGYSYCRESGREEEFLLPLYKNASYTCDLSLLSTSLNVLRNNGTEFARVYVGNSIFENQGYFYVLEGVILLTDESYLEAKSSFIKALSFELPSVIRCYILTLLEKTCAALKEFENAYGYMTMRKSLNEKL